MKKVLAVLMVTLMVFGMTACGSSKTSGDQSKEQTSASTDKTAAEGDIVIGCLQDTTGVTSTLGKMIEGGAQWAVDEINAAGGVNGRKIKMVTYDTKADV